MYVVKKKFKKKLVKIKKHAFGKNRPYKETVATKWHGVYVNEDDEDFVRLINLINDDSIKYIKSEEEFVYTVCLKDIHTYMHANNLKVETTSQTHRAVPLITK